ncbi:MAG: putative cell wall binding repeat 2-containing protein [Acidimicrobiales bacterium]|jgi:putative cell wall-binding protein|nr:putative cell wall binding repeat 2-containing protein [Acidimicrobiales bacterium]
MRSRGRWAAALSAVAIGAVLLPSSVSAATGATPPVGTSDRIAGADRYATSVAISNKLPLGPHYVVLARGDVFADALAASPATNDPAGPEFAPVLLTPGAALDARVKNEIDRRLDPGDSVLIMGGDAALSPSIDAAVVAGGYKAIRLVSYLNGTGQPVDRFDTAAALAESLQSAPTTKLSQIIVASGLKFPDALSASSYASMNGIPVLLGTPSGMPAATQKFLNAHADNSTTVHVIGGPLAVAQPSAPAGISVVPHAGTDRYHTATLVAKDLLGLNPSTSQSFDNLVLARGDDAGGGADALSGGPLSGSLGSPLLLTDPNTVPAPLQSYISGLGYDRPLEPANSYLLGGTAAITAATATSWSKLLNGLLPVAGRSATYRDTVSGSSAAPSTSTVNGCQASQRQQVFTLDAAGDMPGKLTVTAQFCAATPTLPPIPPPSSETETVLPGTAVSFTPTGGVASAGKVIGGFAANDVGQPPGVQTARRTTIDFVIDTANLVGHLNFVNNGGSAISDGVLAVVGAATRQSFDGNFSGTLPSAGNCDGSIGFNGALGVNTFNIVGMTWCKLASSDSTDIYRISGGVVIGGTYTGQVIAGVRRAGDLGLQIRTDQGLVDIYAALSGSPLHATGSQSPGMVQLMPENQTGLGVSIAGTTADSDSGGCPAGTPNTASGLKTGHTFAAGVVTPHFPGTLNIQNVRECQTDAGTPGMGVVEPTDDGGNGSSQCQTLGDPNTSRTVLYTINTPSGPKTFRGRIMTSTYSGVANRIYGLTLLIEENNTHQADCPIPGQSKNVVDDPGQSFTIVRLMVTVNGTNSAITFAR